MGDLEVIGLGYSRTGTSSLKRALDLLGFPSYHMLEVFNRPSDSLLWLRVADEPENRKILLEKIFASYKATVDLPSILFWRELIEYNPKAKIILTLRDPNSWYDSFQSTILHGHQSVPRMLGHYISNRGLYRMLSTLPLTHFKDCIMDRKHIIEVFERYNADIIKHVPAERLLIYRIEQGWKPLCDFLNVPIPEEPFPHVNDRQEMLLVLRKFKIRGWLFILAIGIVSLMILLFFFAIYLLICAYMSYLKLEFNYSDFYFYPLASEEKRINKKFNILFFEALFSTKKKKLISC